MTQDEKMLLDYLQGCAEGLSEVVYGTTDDTDTDGNEVTRNSTGLTNTLKAVLT